MGSKFRLGSAGTDDGKARVVNEELRRISWERRQFSKNVRKIGGFLAGTAWGETLIFFVADFRTATTL